MRIIITWIVLFSGLSLLKGQEHKFTYCDNVPAWDDFVLDTSFDASQESVLVVTNRPYMPEYVTFLPNEIAEWRKVSYFLAYCKNERWHLKKIDNLQEGLKTFRSEKDILLFVHGHGKDFTSSLSRSYQVKHRYSANTIVFDWPSYNNNFNKSLSRVRRCGENFHNLLLQLETYRKVSPNEQKMSIMAHSLGNYFLTHMVVNGNNQYMNEPFIDNVIMNAAAVKSKGHNEVLEQIEFAKRLYVLTNESDRVLRGAHLLMSGKMLGNVSILPIANNAEYIYFDLVAGKQHTYFAGYHEFEYSNSTIFIIYNTLIHGNKLILTDSTRFLPLNDGQYKVLP
jgi:hypothetical protein